VVLTPSCQSPEATTEQTERLYGQISQNGKEIVVSGGLVT